jgi:hypothetical protein
MPPFKHSVIGTIKLDPNKTQLQAAVLFSPLTAQCSSGAHASSGPDRPTPTMHMLCDVAHSQARPCARQQQQLAVHLLLQQGPEGVMHLLQLKPAWLCEEVSSVQVAWACNSLWGFLAW